MKLLNDSDYILSYNINDLLYIHEFLFSEKELNCRLNDKDIIEINNLIRSININNLEEVINDIWYYQIFKDGNTRTLTMYLAMILKEYDIKFNLNNNIKSGKYISLKQK